LHNKKIRDDLKSFGIDIEKAFNYKHEERFESGGKLGEIDSHSLVKAFSSDITQLKASLEKYKQSSEAAQDTKNAVGKVSKILKLLSDFQRKTLRNGTSDFLQKMKTSDNFHQLEEIHKLLKDTLTSLTDKSSIEFATHLLDRIGLIKNMLSAQTMNQVKLLPKKSFCIKVLDKNAEDTFLLGKYVGCCLAPEGGQFPAMVQRRMDDAMFMHVVIDESTQKPIALAWLFFAQDRDNPRKVYVVANFVEITAKYGNIASYRDEIIQNLIDYIGKYAKEIGAEGFLMNRLSYGLIPDFQQFEDKKIKVSNVGGFMELGESMIDYYLNSLFADTFHDYNRLRPEVQSSNNTSATSSSVSHYRLADKNPSNNNSSDNDNTTNKKLEGPF